MMLPIRYGVRSTFLVFLVAFLLLLVACEGEVGGPGPQGQPGDAGVPGSPGKVGSPGELGTDGPSGNPGPMGSKGAPGASGVQGELGPRGPGGSSGAQGNAGPTGNAGVVSVYDSSSGIMGVVDLRTGVTKMDVVGAGFGSGSAVTIWVNGEQIAGGEIIATASGAFSTSGITLPAGFTAGAVVSVKASGSSGTTGWGVLLVIDKDSSN